MKHIAIFCVNYNSYDELHTFIASVTAAAKHVGRDQAEVSLFVADNTVEDRQPIDTTSDILRIKTATFDNVGYFGAAGRMMAAEADIARYDFVFITNVDVQLAPEAFTALLALNIDTDTGWIAPRIYSRLEKRDRNPSVVHRYTLAKLHLLRLMFRYPILHKIQYATIYRRKRLAKPRPAGPIYAGHGSFIILTAAYIRRCGVINYPLFLYGEELYLGEQCLRNGLKVMYEPSVEVFDEEHISTSKMGNTTIDRYKHQSIDYILKTYY